MRRRDHWDVIEGQGSLSHPSYAGVSLGLLHGSQPDVIVVCHEPGRAHLIGHPELPVPSIEYTIELNLALGRRTNPAIRCGGVSLNTSQLSDAEARAPDRERVATAGPAGRRSGAWWRGVRAPARQLSARVELMQRLVE